MIIKDIIKSALYIAGLAPKAAVRGIVDQTTADKMQTAQPIITSLFRRAVTIFLGARLLGLINSGAISQGDADAVTEIAVSSGVLVIISLWTHVIIPVWENKIAPWINTRP